MALQMVPGRIPEAYETLATAASERRSVWSALMPRRGRALLRTGLSASVALADIAAIVSVTLIVELGYYLAFMEDTAWVTELRGLQLAGLLSLIIVSTNALREEYALDGLLAQKPNLQRVASLWLVAWAAVLVVGFLTKTTNDYSRLVSIAIFVTGLPVLLLVRNTMRAHVRRGLMTNSATASRVHLVGYESDIANFYAGNEADSLGLRVVGTSYLRSPEAGADVASRHEQLQEDLDLAVSVVRFLRPDDVFVLVPWSDTADVERCIDAFLRVPAALHLRPGAVLDRFPDMQVARVGRVSGINIGRRALNVGEITIKRVIDLALSLVALIALAPLFAVVAGLIKLDSRGPVLFRQRRYGFNQQPFDVFKFRSMRTHVETGFQQARRGDSRITRVGAILRRTNLDELPQLLNVVLGDMSLVGPRPHALAHDRSFERRIALYARRHNVRPGITGWAQVNGYRGETLTDADMRGRVEHDLHYIDNWSVWLDIQIIVQTLVSRRAYRNAF